MVTGTALASAMALAGPAPAVPVGEVTQLNFSSAPELTFNPVDRRFLVAGDAFDYGWAANDVPAEGPLEARWRFGRGVAGSSDDAIVAHDPQRNAYLVIPNGSVEPDGVLALRHAAEDGRLLGTTVVGPVGAQALEVVFDERRGEHLVVLEATGATGRQLLAQRVSAEGVPVGEPVTLSDRPGVTTVGEADVALLPGTGETLVVWTGRRADGTTAIFAQRLDDQAREVGADDVEVSRHPGAQGDARSPAVPERPAGPDVLVVWSDAGGVVGRQVRDRRWYRKRHVLLAPGLLRYATIPEGEGGTQPAIAYHPGEDEHLLAWVTTTRPFAEHPETRVPVVVGRHLDRAGRPTGPPAFRLAPPPEYPDQAYGPALAVDPAGDYLAAWAVMPGCCTRFSTLRAVRVAPLGD
jgi:hypothetical protein